MSIESESERERKQEQIFILMLKIFPPTESLLIMKPVSPLLTNEMFAWLYNTFSAITLYLKQTNK